MGLLGNQILDDLFIQIKHLFGLLLFLVLVFLHPSEEFQKTALKNNFQRVDGGLRRKESGIL